MFWSSLCSRPLCATHTDPPIQDVEKEELIFEIFHSRGCKLLSKSQASSSGRWKQAESGSAQTALGWAGREARTAGSASRSSALRTETARSSRVRRRQLFLVFAVRLRTLQTVNKQIKQFVPLRRKIMQILKASCKLFFSISPCRVKDDFASSWLITAFQTYVPCCLAKSISSTVTAIFKLLF